MKNNILRFSGACLALLITFSGCDSADSSDSEQMATVALNIVATNAPVAAKDAPFAAKSGAAVPEITGASVLLRTIQFHNRDESDTEDGFEYRTEPIIAVIDPLDPPVSFVLNEVPFGTYHKVSFRIHKPDEAETDFEGAGFWTGPGGNERFSVLVDGTLDAQPFEYKSSKAMQQKIDFEEDLEVDENTTEVNVTLLVDLSKWFVDDNGEALDPTDTSPANANAIDKSIRESFRIFKDKNKDAVPD